MSGLSTLTGKGDELASGESPELLGPRVDGVDLITKLPRYPVLETIGCLVVRQEPQRLNHPGDPEMVVVVGVPPLCRVEEERLVAVRRRQEATSCGF